MTNTNKKIAILFAVLCLAVSFAASAYAGPKIMKVGFVAARNTAQAKAMYKFVELVEKGTKGSIKGEVFPESQLGGIREMIEATQMNVCQVYFGGAGDFAPFSPRFNLLEMHMLIPHDGYGDYEAGDKIFDSKIPQDILKDLEKINLKGLAYWDNGYKHLLNNKKPINTYKDIKGLKIRTIENAAQVDAIKAWGGLPVVIPFAEVFTSLNQGLVDGIENQIGNIINSNFYQATKYMTLSGSLYMKAPVTMSKIFFDSLTDNEKKVVMQAAKDGAAYARQLIIDEDREGLKFIRSKGIKIVEKMNSKDVIEMRKQLRPMYEANVKKYDPKGGAEFMKAVDKAWSEWEKKNNK